MGAFGSLPFRRRSLPAFSRTTNGQIGILQAAGRILFLAGWRVAHQLECPIQSRSVRLSGVEHPIPRFRSTQKIR